MALGLREVDALNWSPPLRPSAKQVFWVPMSFHSGIIKKIVERHFKATIIHKKREGLVLDNLWKRRAISYEFIGYLTDNHRLFLMKYQNVH
jgi:hypothetical protein